MAEIIPRWEWRTFGQDFGNCEEKIKQYGEKGFKKSEEKYILSKVSDENIKIRDDLIDIKSLRQVNDDRLEQWFPAMKEGFPATKEKMEILFRDYFKVNVPEFARDNYTYTQFLEELVAPCEWLCVVDVYKERHAYEINNATVEIAETKFNGVPMRTVCVEHTDPVNVINTVRELELTKFDNINYINAMKCAVGMERVQ
jgi:exopolyphosphatase/guanosine-5'-triphosphate,3'-diphosphate pyrophosphatase